MRENIKEKVKGYMKDHGMARAGGRVLAAVSGGADSVCLLRLLSELSGEADGGFSLRVLHANHGLRGPEADRDEAFVEELCGKLHVPFQAVHLDVAGFAKKQSVSEEEAGRILRYQALEEAARQWETESGPSVEIALAHHQDDNAETILHHLVRGSGLRGLSGIRPVQGRRIRPLLCLSRREIEAYLRENQAPWCEDSTNQSDAYTRNRLRRQALPLLEEQINRQASVHIVQAAQIIAQADQYLERQAGALWEKAGYADGKRAGMKLQLFLDQEEIIQIYLLRIMLDRLLPGWKDVTARHFKGISELALKPVGSRMSLPGGLWAEVGYECLELKTETAEKMGTEGLLAGTAAGLDWRGEETGLGNLDIHIFPAEKGTEIPKNQYTKWFDYDRIKGTLSFRVRQQGDYITLAGGGRKQVTRYMIDEKIPRHFRDEIPVLAEGNHVLWVVGFRISEYYKVTERTQTILQVVYNGGEKHGR